MSLWKFDRFETGPMIELLLRSVENLLFRLRGAYMLGRRSPFRGSNGLEIFNFLRSLLGFGKTVSSRFSSLESVTVRSRVLLRSFWMCFCTILSWPSSEANLGQARNNETEHDDPTD